MRIRNRFILIIFVLILGFVGHSKAQTTAFSYQGSLKDGGSPANGSFQMQFKLFDSLAGSGQVGPTISDVAITANQGAFSVKLDFGSNALSGANRFLEIAVRRNSGESYVTLTPREQIASAPYSIRTLSAASADALSSACAGCVQDANINSVSGTKVTGTVANATNATSATNAVNATNAAQLGGLPANQYVTTVSVGNTFIKNTNIPQTADFNILGNGTVGGLLFAQTMRTGVIDAINQYNIEGNRVLSIRGTDNLFVGVGAGENNTSIGNGNAFFGAGAGQSNTNGGANSFFGRFAGIQNTQGSLNSFFGERAGRSNTLADNNSIFGARAGTLTDTGSSNSFFGAEAGFLNSSGAFNTFAGYQSGASSTGSFNSFVGANSGQNNTGNNNAFFGYQTGMSNGPGSNNTLFGAGANVGAPNLTNATAIGAGALVNASNTLVLGRSLDSVRVPGSIDIFGPVTGAFVLAPVNGGTGLNSSGGAGNYLRSNGTTWTSSPLLAPDIPFGSNHYIQNTTAMQTANFSISGNGSIAGTVGIGITAPGPGFPNYRLDVAGNTRIFNTDHTILNVQSFGQPGTGAFLTFNTVAGVEWTLGTRRGVADNAFFITGPLLGLPVERFAIKPDDGPVIFPSGTVGIGTETPGAKLFIDGESPTSTGGGASIGITGRAVQPADKGGWVKAALFVDWAGNIIECFNGVTGASTSGCGFTATRTGGIYRITLGFTPRFATATVWAQGTTTGAGAMLNFILATTDVQVLTWDPDLGITAKSFMLIVF